MIDIRSNEELFERSRVSEGEETEEQVEGTLHCPLCNFVMKQMAGMISCTNPMCPNNKGMAA